jgi:hypothetical protein
VELRFEVVEGDLAHDRVDHVLDLAGEERLLGLGVRRLGQELSEGQHLAEHARRLGKRQGRGAEKLALAGGEDLVDAVAQLVGERHHVPGLSEVVQHHEGMHVRHRGMGKGAGGLAGLDRRVDPAAVEEGCRELGEAGVEGGIGVGYGARGLVPADEPVVPGGSGALRSQT